MANEKISQMPLISTFASGDLFPIVDISEASAADRNKSVTFGELFRNVLGGSASDPSIAFTGDQNTGIYSPGADQVAVATNGAQRITVDASGRLLVGTTSARSNIDGGNTPQTQFEGVGYPGATFSITRNSTDSGGPGFYFAKTRSGSIGGIAAAQSGDTLGQFIWTGSDGTNTIKAASIDSFVDGTPGANDMPGRLVFSTTADGASSPTERLRITSAGLVGIGTSSPSGPLDVVTGSEGAIFRFSAASTNLQILPEAANGNVAIRMRANSGAAPNFQLRNDAGSNLVTITNGGSVGIGTTSPASVLNIVGTTTFNNTEISGGYNTLEIIPATTIGSSVNRIVTINTTGLSFETAGSERARIDTSGRLLVGTSTARSNIQISTGFGSVTPNHQFETSAATYAGLSLINNSTGYPAVFSLGKSRSAGGIGSNGIVANGDIVGMINFYGNDDSKFVRAATITAVIDGTPGADDMPGRLVFSTTADGASSSTERMRVTNSGLVRIGMSDFDAAPSATNAGLQLFNTTAGAIISASSGTASSAHALFFNPNGIVGRIDTSKDAVDADGNPVYQGIDQSKLVPLLTAALQEAIGRIETLEGMVAVNNITIDEQQHQLSTLAARLTALESA
jgi:hypothetical protein